MRRNKDTTVNPQIAARQVIEESRHDRAVFATILTATLVSASAALLWISVGALTA